MTRPPVQEVAGHYINLGLPVVPLKPRSKKCVHTDWLTRTYTPDDFGHDANLGIKQVNGVVDIDHDCDEAAFMAEVFLPKTSAVYGRPSRPLAHWLYLCAEVKNSVAHKDLITKTTLVELRVNHQSMAPPSIHPNGEAVSWVGPFSGLPEAEKDLLTRSVQLVATGAMVCRYYNLPGARHDWCQALAGFLRRLGVTEAEATRLLRRAAEWAKDTELKDRLASVRSTYSVDEDTPTTGGKTLAEHIGADGEKFVATLRKIWGGDSPRESGGFFRTSTGVVKNPENIRRALDKLGVTASRDLFAQESFIHRDGQALPLDDNVVVSLWMEVDATFKFLPAKDLFYDVVMDLSRRNSFHPVRDYLDALTWDGVPRIDRWLVTYGKAKDTKLIRAQSAIVLIAAVRRIRHPGCKFDELLVLISAKQGTLKSSAVKVLCPKESWFSDDLPLNVDAKQIIERTCGKWIIEAAELNGFSKRELDHLKASMSRQVDGPVRLAYGRLSVQVPRQFINIGTINVHQFLKDKTGNRRFWPVEVQQFDLARLTRDRDQLWAEAAHREAAGESIRLDAALWTAAAQEQEARLIDDPWVPILREFLQLDEVDMPDHVKQDVATDLLGPRDRVLVSAVWDYLEIDKQRRDERSAERITSVMQSLGYEKKQARGLVKGDEQSAKRWCRIEVPDYSDPIGARDEEDDVPF